MLLLRWRSPQNQRGRRTTRTHGSDKQNRSSEEASIEEKTGISTEQTRHRFWYLVCMFPWSGQRDSNPRMMAWEAIALPLGYARSEKDYTLTLDIHRDLQHIFANQEHIRAGRTAQTRRCRSGRNSYRSRYMFPSSIHRNQCIVYLQLSSCFH
jgi:hypothetical protein